MGGFRGENYAIKQEKARSIDESLRNFEAKDLFKNWNENHDFDGKESLNESKEDA